MGYSKKAQATKKCPFGHLLSILIRSEIIIDLLQNKALLQTKPLDKPGAIIILLTAEGKQNNSIACFARKVFIFVQSLILQEVL